MKVLALDLGDQWVGVALSDACLILARPFTTVAFSELQTFLKKTFEDESIDTVIVGYPQTLKGTESAQTKKVVAQKEDLEKLFPFVSWVLWDERLSSKHAQSMGKKGDKLHIHAKAAALILDSYLTYLRFKREQNNS